ncbi:MAG: aminotransferase class I/II-fold pyridoxal phosphate-dependent enzyme [Rhodospirillaceae bacterium]|nr:aminotransferase class I/II-fold pyridoxal phosphate-dependent enzyme [Rhodospirillaceae bacterium]
MRQSRLLPGKANIFQKIRAKRSEVLAAGMQLLDLSIGEPKGPALLSAREAARDAVMSDEEVMHAYQYNLDQAVPEFSVRFVRAHLARDLPAGEVAYLPIMGIKPVLGLLPLAAGCANKAVTVATMTAPGYPIPADWCDYHPHADHYALNLSPENEYLFDPNDIRADTDLIMINYPHNPSGQVAGEAWLRALCAHCEANDIRLFNDAAYYCLTFTDDTISLSEVAIDYPDLSWAEGFTAAKLIGNGTGWHVGAMAGSKDFIADIAEVKGKTDAGLVAPMAAGALHALENDQAGIEAYRNMYSERLDLLMDLLSGLGMRLALKPRAGFYTLWEAPASAFGRPMASSEEFNMAMIEETGVVGVHFPGCIRYAVCADVGAMQEGLRTAFQAASVEYA